MNDVAFGVAKEHILKLGGTFEFFSLPTKGNYLAIVTHPSLSANIEETMNTVGLTDSLAEEYVHCRVHAIASKLISRLYPYK